ncbi:alphaherpesvirus glycoprotein E domain-containing protein [Purpureocillium lavendulum]|uniref:Alphaherpesvirus glycoprotein E domain-containing protein n=1 Tax=Purpureocillium lavendulum TaxID=1247861 RepID=A0AB34G0N5_9HYPO|nr:alphaherpesvirus glycoprotein E domain-containing protein [Purpureocillium lavendulum]
MDSEPATAHQASKDDDGAVGSMAQNESKIDKDQVPTSSVLEVQLAEEVRLRRFTEDVLDNRQEELEAQEAENKKLLKKLESLKKELAETQDQLIEARNQSKAKAKQLQDARDQIFRLQPRRKDITESEAQETYKKLCGNVQRWVENRLPGTLDDMEGGRLRARPLGAYAGRFASLIREPAKRCLSLHQADEHHVIAIIMYYLWLALFSKSFYCPLDGSDDEATIMWIDELESTMSKLPRDAAHCREWRSETLTALTNQPMFKSRRTAYINMVSDDLAALLSVVVPKVAPSELQSSVRRTIIEPAADFAHQLQLASNIYSLKWPARNASTRLEVYECINLANGGLVLDLSGTGPSSPSRRKVSYLFDVAPGLFVERVEVGKKAPLKAIYRPNVLVYAGDGEAPQRPTLIKWLVDNSSTGASSRDPLPPPRTTAPRSKALPSSLAFSKL